MRRRILLWHLHGSYLAALTRAEHDWFLPVTPERSGLYGGSRPDLPEWVHDIPVGDVRNQQFDLVLYQSPREFFDEGPTLLSKEQRQLPFIYLEHNVPPLVTGEARHPLIDTSGLVVHVTRYNQLMWHTGNAATTVIEHSVAIDPGIRAIGDLPRGAVVCNELQRRGRAVGLDVFLQARESVPLDLMGIDSEKIGGIGDIPYPLLHPRLAHYRFLFSPMRATSLPLAVIEAMTIGLPVVALATTEVPTVIEHGVTGFISCDPGALVNHMQQLVADPELARRLGTNARDMARRRFGLDRFVQDWNNVIERAITGVK